MKESNKMHRASAVAAAIFMILSQLLDIAAARSANTAYTSPFSLLNLLGDTLVTVMLSVILFRGKKDTASGVVFLITILFPVFEVFYELVVLLFTTETAVYALLCLVSALLLAAFRGLLAGECFKQRQGQHKRRRNAFVAAAYAWLLCCTVGAGQPGHL